MDIVWDWTSTDGSVKTRIVKKGIRAQRPNMGSRCQFALNNDEEQTLTIGNADTPILLNVERVLMTMTCGEVVEVISDDFTGLVRLIHFERNRDTFQLTRDEKYKLAESCKELGVSYYKDGNNGAALRQFVRAAQLLVFLGRRSEENQKLFLAVTSNLAQVHLNLGRLEDSVSAATKVLEIQPDDVKSLLRRASAHQRLRDFEKSRDDYSKALELEPTNVTAKSALTVVKKEISNMNERYECMVKQMFK